MAQGRAPRTRRDRNELAAAFDRETRRLGSVATLLNHAVADFMGLHNTDQQCLDLLDWTGPLTAGEIGRHLGLTSGAVTALIDRLEAADWVERQRDPEDRRRVIVHVSPTRLGEVVPLYESLAEAITHYREQLSASQLRTVVEFLEFANDAITQTTEHARTMHAAEPER